jgi:hypothetical protein
MVVHEAAYAVLQGSLTKVDQQSNGQMKQLQISENLL